MDMQKLKYFINIVEHGTISRAAKALNMTQPPLSIILKKFEEEIGLNLFQRKGKRLFLTESGHFMYKRGIELIASAEAILNEARIQEQGNFGTISIGSATVSNFALIPEVMKRISERSINLSVEVKEGSTPYILDHLRYHRLDIGIIRNVYNRDDLTTTKLLTEPLIVALPPNHPLAEKKSVKLEELKDEKFLLHHSSFEYDVSETIILESKKRGFSPTIAYWGNETLPMLGMVNAGMGIAFPAKSVLKSVGFNLPPLVELSDPVILTNLNMVTVKNHVKTDAVSLFLEVAQEVIDEMKQEFGMTSMNETE